MNKELENEIEPDKVRMNLWLPLKLYKYVEHIASTEDRTYTEVIKEALREKMKRDKTIKSGDDQCK